MSYHRIYSKINKTIVCLAIVVVGIIIYLVTSFCCDKSNPMFLYTSQPIEHIDSVVDYFKAKNHDINIKIYRSGTTEVLNKIKAESFGGNINADLLLIADSYAMDYLKHQNYLHAYNDVNINNIPTKYTDPEKYYFGTKLIKVVFVYNKDLQNPPKDWNDLFLPQFKDNIVMASPMYSGLSIVILEALYQHKDFGKSYYQKLKANNVTFVSSNGAVLDQIIRKEKHIGVCADFMVKNAIKKGANINYNYPQKLEVVISEPIAILQSSKDKKTAQLFVDFLLSKEGQKLACQLGYIPIDETEYKLCFKNKDVPFESWPDLIKIKDVEQIKLRFNEIFRQ